MTSRFATDRSHAKLLGVCAGVARSLDADPLVVRLVVFLSMFLLGPIVPAAYLVTAWLADRA